MIEKAKGWGFHWNRRPFRKSTLRSKRVRRNTFWDWTKCPKTDFGPKKSPGPQNTQRVRVSTKPSPFGGLTRRWLAPKLPKTLTWSAQISQNTRRCPDFSPKQFNISPKHLPTQKIFPKHLHPHKIFPKQNTCTHTKIPQNTYTHTKFTHKHLHTHTQISQNTRRPPR